MNESKPSQSKQQAAFLRRLAEAREGFFTAIAGLDPAVLYIETVVDGWTVKDILGHLVSWNEEFREDIRTIRAGVQPGSKRRISGEDDFAEWNSRWISLKASWTWERIFDDFERDFEEAEKLIRELSPQDLSKEGVTPWQQDGPAESVETLVSYHWRHINQHTRMIERWREQRQEELP